MIDIIGVRKVILIVMLAVFAGALYFYGFLYLEPQLIKEDHKLKRSKSEFLQIKTNMDNLVVGLEKFDVQKEEFNKLRSYGFFDDQDRLKLSLRFKAMQERSRLLSAKYTISPAKTEVSQLAKEADFKVLNTKVSLELDAVQDVDIYKFIHLLNYGFPAQVFISNLTISRNVKVTKTLIQRLGSGAPVSIVKATLQVNLRTMVEDESVKKTEEGL